MISEGDAAWKNGRWLNDEGKGEAGARTDGVDDANDSGLGTYIVDVGEGQRRQWSVGRHCGGVCG